MSATRYLRLIPRLDIKGPNLVKGIRLEGLRVLGNPNEYAKHYYESGADEIFYMDIVASLYNRNSLTEIVSNVSKDVFIPITVGGGLRTVDDISKVLSSGADKVSLNTAAVNDPDLINRAAKKFGSSTIVLSVEVIKESDGKYYCFTDNGREATGLEAYSWIKKAVDLGAGEVAVTSVDREGTGEGFDIDLIGNIASSVNVPVIAHGGAGSLSHVIELAKSTDVSGICVASIFHYQAINEIYNNDQNVIKSFNTTNIKRDSLHNSKIKPVSFKEAVAELKKIGIVSRSL